VLGMNGHISKPIDPEVLYATLAGFLTVSANERPGPVTAANLRPTTDTGQGSPELPLIMGLDIAAGLRHTSGNKALYAKLLASFARDFVGFADNMQRLLQSGQSDEALRQAHTLKGLAATLGAHEVRSLTTTLESSIRDGIDPAEVRQQLTDTGDTLDALLGAIRMVFVDTDGLPQHDSQSRPAPEASPDAAPLIEDGGVPDGGAPDSGIVECRNSAQCANQAACIDAANSLACGAGSANCFCRPPCDPFSTVSPCNNGDSCYWFSFPPDNSGACVPLGTGGDLGEPCTTTFDGQGMETSNTCSAFKNLFCLGGIPSEPSGTCSRYCTTSSNICGSLGDYQCIEGSAGSGFGRCVNTISTAMDIGDQCTGPASCDDMCSTQLDVCTAACPNDLDLCPRNTVCVYLPQEDWRCLKACVTDAECTPPGHICENVNPPGSPELKICRPPRCTMDSECAGATCRISSGFCQP